MIEHGNEEGVGVTVGVPEEEAPNESVAVTEDVMLKDVEGVE